ncbi:hypothetical protein XbrCFBP1976_09550 [Xanthomonas bromi]|uniref:Uncharacterized protein n=1 Tax=Xanthomonas bromi TaxID=56449 RepID=A0ABX5BQ93_9XANT|nr:hypothetical protein XbrCFBP1976_09550 [Xanthomonas bromi]
MRRLLVARAPALETPNSIREYLAFAHAHLSNGLLAQIHAVSIALGKDRSCLFLVMGVATVISG